MLLVVAGSLDTIEASKPNVLFVISDDLNCRIGCYGDPIARTPNVDRLAAQGVRFERAYCQFPLCNPTRCSVLSGRYPTTTGVLDNDTILMLDDGMVLMPAFFAENGYAVAEHGKIWHGPNNGSLGVRANRRPRWFTPAERAEQQAADPDYWEKNHSPYRHREVERPERYAWANVYGPLDPGDRGRDAPTADAAIASLRRFAADSTPFFLAVGFRLPHVPLTAPREFFDLYDPTDMPLPPDFANEPTLATGLPQDEWRTNIDLFAGRPFSVEEAREAIRAYYASTSYMDAQLGRVLDELDALGLDGNTIIAFWGDHGWHLSEKGMWAKGTTFEVSARGPLIIVDPRKSTGGKASERVVEYLDIYPTLAELCGLDGPAGLEGTSLVPLLEDPQVSWDKPAYTVQTRGWYLGRSVRTERWRYTEWDEGRRGTMLFDHAGDPGELRNLADDPSLADVAAELRRLLRNGPVAGRN
jgi:arylsulfatase A-like enzyme